MFADDKWYVKIFRQGLKRINKGTLDGYVPLDYLRDPQTKMDLWKSLGFDPAKGFTKEYIETVKKREIQLLTQAAFAANAAFGAMINFIPVEEQKWIEPTMQKLREVCACIREQTLRPTEQVPGVDDLSRRLLREAVTLAANVCNNMAPLRMPPHLIRVALETRDLCDESLSQPRFS